MLPNVKVTVTEEVNLSNSNLNTFLPLVIVKTKTGPIGTETLIKTSKSFNDTFGTPDSSTPEAFGIAQYIKNYGNAYIVRVASASASEGSGKITDDNTDLISISTKYKTDSLNGIDVELNLDTDANKLYITSNVGNKIITSIKETINYGTAKADELEKALNKVVSSFNDAQNLFVLTNSFTGKTAEDTKPKAFTNIKGTISGGISGNDSVLDTAVMEIIEKYRKSDLGIDAILAPGFESADVVNKLVSVAEDSSFIAIASVSGSTANAILGTASSYNFSSSLALYADKVYLYEDTSIEVPTCIAVLPAYITKDKSSKWLAPAGVTRGTLSLVSGLVHPLSDSDLEDLYTSDKPVNGIKKIAGRGFIVWGQKTCASDNTEYQDRINVVRLIKYLTKEVYSISYDYLFEPITDYTYNSWTLRVEAILDEIKSGNGLSEYKVIMDDTLNTEETKKQNKLIGAVRLKPLEAAEYIEINFVVTDDVQGGNE